MKSKLDSIDMYASAKSFIAPINYIFGQTICEYDMSKANITVLKAFGRITKEEYDYLYNLPKDNREYEIGMKIRSDKKYQDYIDEGVAYSKKMFLELNHVDLQTILRIANDSFYIVSPYICTNLQFLGPDNETLITFSQKGSYNVFLKLHGNLFFCNTLGDYYDIDVKGIRDDQLPLHSKFLTFIAELCNDYIIGGKEIAIRNFNEFYDNYVKRKLEIEYYREFRSGGGFRYDCKGMTYFLQATPDENATDKIDISYNLNVLRTLYAYILSAGG